MVIKMCIRDRDKEKEDKKTENMIAIEATTKNKVGFDTYA